MTRTALVMTILAVVSAMYLFMELVSCLMIRADSWHPLMRVSAAVDKTRVERWITGWVFREGSMTTVKITYLGDWIALRVARRPGGFCLAKLLLPDVYLDSKRLSVVSDEGGARKAVIACHDRDGVVNLWSRSNIG